MLLVLKMKYKLFWFFFVFSTEKMKCLLCSKFKDQKELLDDYLSYHNIDENNRLFQKLFQSNNKTLLKNVLLKCFVKKGVMTF